MQKEKVLEIIKDKEFLNSIINLNDIEDVKKAFKSKGINVTDQDIEEMRKCASNYVNNIEKIPENFLDNIIGGAKNRNNQTVVVNNYINNNNNSSFRSGSSTRSATNVEGTVFGSIFILAGALIMGTAVRSGIRDGWFAPMC